MPYVPVVTNIVGIGNIAVDIFFFFSGLCLGLSVNKHDYQNTGWKNYYKRRLSRIFLPYLIICIPYYLWAAAFESSGGVAKKVAVFFANLSSASFWLRGTQTTWYVYGILVFYALFPAIYTFVKRNVFWKRITLLLGMVLFAVLAAYVPILKHSLIVWARLPIFTIGVISGTEQYKDRGPKTREVVVAVIIVVMIGWITSKSELSESFNIPSVYRLLLYIPLTVALLLLLSMVGKKIGVLEWVGSVSLEVYLIHITLLHPLRYYGIMDAVGYWLYLILPAVTLIIAWVVGKIERLILKQGVGT